MDIRVNEHKGMATQIAHEKLPTYLYQKIHNLELSKKLGRMVKRGGYANVLTSGLTTLNGMKEFTDKNGGRQILLQDGTGLEESVYTGGAYSAISAIANDEREAVVAPTVTQMYPVLHENVLRSGAGIAATHDHPFWYGYNDAVTRFPNVGTPTTITAGKYLEDQIYKGKLLTSFLVFTPTGGESKVADKGLLKAGSYFLYVSPVLDGYQKGIPETPTLYKVLAFSYDYNYIKIDLSIATANRSSNKRITAIDVFVAKATGGHLDDSEIYPAYFLERVNLDSNGSYILEKTGTLEDTGGATPPTYIEFDDDFADWETFSLTNLYANFTTSEDTYNAILGARSENTTKVRYAVTGTVEADSGDAITVKVFSRWYDGSGVVSYPIVYDDYHRKLGSEMYTYLDIPTADTGLTDTRYKFSCMANKRYFIFGTPDGAFGYYSKTNNPDVIPSQNILRLQREPTGCIGVGRDVIAFYPSSSKRFTILSNANADEDDTFSNIGLTSQKAVLNITDEEAYGFDLRGPWELHLRSHRFIGSLLTDWWEDELSEAEKNACVVSYNRLKDWVLYSFPTYTGTHDGTTYTGIVFVFDRGYYLKSGRQIEPWWILKTDHLMYNWTIAEDNNLHLLTGSKTAIVDWNEPLRANQNEDVDTLAHIKLLKNPILGNKTHFDMLYLYYVSDTDAMVGRIRPDGGSWATLTINGDQQSFIRYICETLEVELSTAASDNDVEISEEAITFTPLRGA